MIGQLSDNELMLQVKDGDIDKMTILYDRYKKILFGFLFHLSGHKQSSEDMLQNVFYRMLKYRHTYLGKGEFKNWMYLLALNVFKDYQRIHKRNNHNLNIEHYNDKIIDHQLADAQIQHDQQVTMLAEAMKKLSEEERKVLVMSQVQKLRYREIAEILKITEGAVKVRVHRAFNQLKDLYFKTIPYEAR